MSLYKLIVDSACDFSDFDILTEETNNKSTPNLYISGPYMAAEEVNRNKRIYTVDEMASEVDRYINEKIKNDCALGELNHPPSADINLERACHRIVELKRDGNVWLGKARVLSSPCGNIIRCLINDGTKIGMSTRCLGQLNEESQGINRVKNMRLIAVDCVADPSYSKAFVNGILESKSYNIEYGELEEVYEKFEDSLKTLPKSNRNEYYVQKISEFLNKLSGK